MVLLNIPAILLPANSALAGCTQSASGVSYTVPPSSYTQQITQCSSANGTVAGPVTISNSSTVNVTANGSTNSSGIDVYSQTSGAGQYSNNNGVNQANSGNVSLSNNGVVTVTGNSSVTVSLNGLLAQSIAGAGGNGVGSNNPGGTAGNAVAVSVTNNATVSLGSFAPQGGAVIAADSFGGAGGNLNSGTLDGKGNAAGGNGGGSGSVMLTNAATISAGNSNINLGGDQGVVGLQAQSIGGAGGFGGNGKTVGAGVGGASGNAMITNSGNVDLFWLWKNAQATNLGEGVGVFGALALSQGGAGGAADKSQTYGAYAGASAAANVTLLPGSQIEATSAGNAPSFAALLQNAALAGFGPPIMRSGASYPNYPVGAAVAAISLGGAGGTAYDSSTGGQGGSAGSATIALTSAEVGSNGMSMPGIVVESIGGAGGNGGVQQDYSNAGPGAAAGFASLALSGTSAAPTAVATTGQYAPAVLVGSVGGAGGAGTNFTTFTGGAGAGGAGAPGSDASATSSGNVAIATSGANAPALMVVSLGGAGGLGGYLAASGGETGSTHGDGGAGAAAGSATLALGAGASIGTTGAASDAVIVQSTGGVGGNGGYINIPFGGYDGFSGGNGGNAGNVGLTIAQDAIITTSGSDSNGVLAQSLGGSGGAAGALLQPFLPSQAGSAGSSGNSGNVDVNNAGSITTTGDAARGILAEAIAGPGGAGAYSASIFYNNAGNGGATGTVGSVSIENSGAVNTTGTGAAALEALALGGEGGAGGTAHLGIISNGGDGGQPGPANGGVVSIINSGVVKTSGVGSFGALALSVGGGGGDAGSSSGVSTQGGTGGGGGQGGMVTVQANGGQIATSGTAADAAAGLSVGGGGGVGGSATAASAFVTQSYGGSGGAGGAGGAVSIATSGAANAPADIRTQGTKSVGLLGLSVGGGGGAGGAGIAFSAGVGFSVASAYGGSGGSGGAGGAVNLSTANTNIVTGIVAANSQQKSGSVFVPTNMLPVDAYGVVAASIGGGGGIGGAASATAFTQDVPLPIAEGVQIGVAVSTAQGGSGGTGASAAGGVTVQLGGSTNVVTGGQGSDAVVAQAIGGGGGIGGDSSALSATFGYGRAASLLGGNFLNSESGNSFVVSLTVAGSEGGSGGAGGNGGPVAVQIGGSGATARILTYGDYADGVLAQSIGGGGGNAGFGSSSTQAFGTTQSLSIGFTVGSSGGGGGAGNSTTVTLNAGSGITTYGSGAVGVLAQSVGGGGGASQGGSLDLGGGFTVDASGGPITNVSPSASLKLAFGGTGSAGGNGGGVAVTVNGSISTLRGDATGVLAQSIGGGGGMGGSTGGDASADNPVVAGLLGVRQIVSTVFAQNLPVTGTLTLDFGGTGGAAGAGGSVNVNLGGSIITAGDWADGIVAQSVGGGGGKGGSAVATGTGGIPQITINLGGGWGGTGGASGNGGAVAVALNGGAVMTGTAPGAAIATGLPNTNGSGFWAFGVLAQSVGGGGGLGGDGSDQSTGLLSLGGGKGGSGGVAGNGGSVTLGGSGGSITTYGDGAHAVVLQSVGGGGGIAGSGSSATYGITQYLTSTESTSVGGGAAASGNGGNVAVNGQVLHLATSGNNAYGLLAQSIGGGGGIAGLNARVAIGSVNLGGNSQKASNGGAVALTLGSGSAIATTGNSSHAIFAQSVGGGGGIAGFADTNVPITNVSPAAAPRGGVTNGSGGAITVNTGNSYITTMGGGADGIFAQSVGAGGGLAVGTDRQGSFAGSSGGSGSYGLGGAITITQAGYVHALGENGVAIFAQSVGQAGNGVISGASSPIEITISGDVRGGSGSGIGVWLDSNSNTNTSGTANSILVNQSGGISATSGNAILQTGLGTTNVTNNGVITGNLTLGPNGILQNNGTLIAGAAVQAGLVNAGTLQLGTPDVYTHTTLTGSFVQTASGVIEPNINFAEGAAATLTVLNDPALAGRVVPAIQNVLPNISVPILTLDGPVSGTLDAAPSTLFGYQLTRDGNVYSVAATSANFSAANLGLDRSQIDVARYLQRLWNAGGTPDLGNLFADLGNAADSSLRGYGSDLGELTPGGSLALGARMLDDLQSFADTLNVCPIYQANAGFVHQGECSWMQVNSRTTTQTGNSGAAGFQIRSDDWQIGGQKQIAPGWFLAASAAYQYSWLNAGYVNGYGQSGLFGIDLKRQWGNWVFSAGSFGSFGGYSTTRAIEIPGLWGALQGSPDVAGVDERLRAAYTIGTGDIYLRPYADLDAVYVRMPGYQEGGSGPLALDFHASDSTTLVATPGVEMGQRFITASGLVLRTYGSVGISLLSNNAWKTNVQFIGAPIGTGVFTAALPMDNAEGRVDLGVQLIRGRLFDLRAEYDGEFSRNLTSHGGSLEAALHF